MRHGRLWAELLGVEGAVVEKVGLEPSKGALIARVRRRQRRLRCGRCGRASHRYDRGSGLRRWRAMDLGTVRAFIEADSPRVHCSRHGVVVSEVPWARHGSSYTRGFEDQTAWLVVRSNKTTVSQLMRVTWRSVGRMLERVCAQAESKTDRFSSLRRIGIDEISYRKGHRYLTLVVDHDEKQLVWAEPGRNEATLERFFDALGPEKTAKIELVSADAAPWIARVLRRRCPHATLCMDPFHVVQWATDALDHIRRRVWNDVRAQGYASPLRDARFALWKNPENLSEAQHAQLCLIEQINKPLFRAYLLKEQLRVLLKLPLPLAQPMLERWLAWASRSKLWSFVQLARSIRRHRHSIEAAIQHRLTNALVEALNTGLRLLTRMAYGFHSHRPLVALAKLKFGGLCPPLPGRFDPRI